MTPTLINGWWLSTDTHLGTSNTSGITDRQKVNATNIYNYLSSSGWSLSAIAGLIGNAQHESFLSPAYIQATNRWRLPNSAANLSDVPNSVMQNFYKEYYGVSTRAFGIGLVQWDGKGITRQKLVGWAMNNGLNWYDGDTQCARLVDEYTRNIQWTARTLYGIRWTWSNYIDNDMTPEQSAHIWRICYEVGGDSSDATRQQNARYWYDYFEDTPPGPGPGPGPEPVEGWITGEEFSQIALSYNGQYLPYDQYDCIGFVNLCWQQIPASSGSLPNGTNRIWRSTLTYQTTSPDGQTPCPVLWYKDTLENCISNFGGIPAGTLLFHKISDEGPPALPPQYAGDGIGNFAHVGIYCGNNEVMQSGGRDSGSVPGGGVHKSTYDPSAWNYAAFVVWVDPTGGEPGPGPEPEPEYWRYLLYAKMTEKRRNLPNARKYYSRFL